MTSAPVASSFDTYGAYRLAVASLFARAKRDVILFDPNLQETGLASRAGVEVLQGFQRTIGPGRLRIVLHDAQPLLERFPRLMTLCAARRHVIDLRVTPEHLRHLTDSFVVADARHLVLRFHRDHARGKLVFDDEAQAGGLVQRFDSLWEECHDKVGFTPLGL